MPSALLFTHSWNRWTNEFVPFPRELVGSETQKASSRVWTYIADFIYDNYCYTKQVSIVGQGRPRNNVNEAVTLHSSEPYNQETFFLLFVAGWRVSSKAGNAASVF